MSSCEKCHITVTGTLTRCPLCQHPLSGGQDSPDIFPEPLVPSHVWRFWTRILAFLSVVLLVVCVTTNYLTFQGQFWSFFVAAGILSLWVSLSIVIRKRHNIPKTILWQVCLVSVMAVLWDILTGWHSWSLNYVLPVLCILAMVAMGVLAKAMGLRLADYLIYLVIDGLFGIVPLVFLGLGWVSAPLPSVVCVGGSIISLAALGSFRSQNVGSEIHRRLHL